MRIRLATVSETGRRYVVQQIDHRRPVVHVWGELTAYRAIDGKVRKAKHAPALELDLDAVSIREVTFTEKLAVALLEQAQDRADDGELPGYATRFQAADKRRRRAAAHRAVRESDVEAYRAAVIVPSCELCGARATHELDSVRLCRSCHSELSA